MLPLAVSIAGEKFHIGFAVRRLIEIENAVLHRDQWRQLRKNQFGYGKQVSLALQQPGELGEVRLQPVLRRVFFGRLAQVPNHFVDVVLESCHLACGIHGNRP